MLLRYPECTVMKQTQVCLTQHVTLQSTNNFTAKYLQKIPVPAKGGNNKQSHTIQHNQAMKERMLAADDV